MHWRSVTAGQARLVAIEIPDLEILHRTGVVTRSEAYLSPLAVRAVELIEAAVAEDESKGRGRSADNAPGGMSA